MTDFNKKNPLFSNPGDIDTYGFRIYGDNIDECIRFSELLLENAESYGLELMDTAKKYSAPIYTFSPTNHLVEKDFYVSFQVCGRFGEWKEGRRPYLGPEDTDIILTHVTEPETSGEPILGVEFNNAIGAGNNAWQRFPRIANSVRRGVPFIYTVPVCDAEVYDGNIRSLRHPNTNVLVAQLILMMRYRTTCLTIYESSPWYQDGLEDTNAIPSVDGSAFHDQLINFIFSLVLENLPVDKSQEQFFEKTLSVKKSVFRSALRNMLEYIRFFLESDFSLLKKHPILIPTNISGFVQELWDHIYSNTPISEKFLIQNWNEEDLQKGVSFSKSTSTSSIFKDDINPHLSISKSSLKSDVIEFAEFWDFEHSDLNTLTKKELLNLLNHGSQSTKKPISYKPPSNEIGFISQSEKFADLIENSYPDLSPNRIITRIRDSDGPLIFLPMAGYVKDTGGFAFSRPDKGGISLMNTLFGNSDVFGEKLILFYHPEIPANFSSKLDKAKNLQNGGTVNKKPNNLWIETARFASLVISDSSQKGWIKD